MTREEAIEELERLLSHWDDLENGKRSFRWYSKDAVGLALTALRPVSREGVEKAWRGEWIECQTAFGEKYNKCSRCGFTPSFGYPAFCASCGSANTGEAVQMVMVRLEALKDG